MKELDVIELRADSGRWPAGKRGTVLEVLESVALVEISDEHGHSLDFLTLPLDALRPVDTPAQETLSV